MPHHDFFDRYFDEHLRAARATQQGVKQAFTAWVDMGAKTLRQGGKILFFGNGGSAADAQHLATELTVRFIKDRAPIAAIALTTDSSALTAIGNDYGFDHLFSRQIEALGKKGDMAVGISTSGKSKNVLNGLRKAREIGITTVALGGGDGGELASCSDLALIVPSKITAHIQEMHICLGQAFCAALEHALGLNLIEDSPWRADASQGAA